MGAEWVNVVSRRPAVTRPGVRAESNGLLWRLRLAQPGFPPGHSPGGRVPLCFALDQDVVAGIHNVVLHRLLGDGRGLGHCNRADGRRSGGRNLPGPWLGERLEVRASETTQKSKQASRVGRAPSRDLGEGMQDRHPLRRIALRCPLIPVRN